MANKRIIQIRYYWKDLVVKETRATTVELALKAAHFNIAARIYKGADILNEHGRLVASVKRVAQRQISTSL